MKAGKSNVGIAHAIFDHGSSLEELSRVIKRINKNPNVSKNTNYELHHQDSSRLELEAGLQNVLGTQDDYRIMNNALRDEYPAENRSLSDHKYVLVAKSDDGHERTAEELTYVMNQLHLLDNGQRIFSGAIVHKDDEKDHYHVI